MFDAAQERLIPRDYVRHVVEPDSYGELKEIAYCGHCDGPLVNKGGKYFCKKCKIEIDEWIIHQLLLQAATEYQKSLPHPDKMNRWKWRALCDRDLIVKGAKQEQEKAWDAIDALMDRRIRDEIEFEEYKEQVKKVNAAWKAATAEYERQKEERDIFEGQMKACVKFVRGARRLTITEILGEGVNPEDLEMVKKLIARATLTKGKDGRKVTAEVKMAEQIKKYYDWWEMFEPMVMLAEY